MRLLDRFNSKTELLDAISARVLFHCAKIVTGDVRPILLMLLGGTFLLLIIACVNVGSLVLVRSESRRREIAVRSALGATLTGLVRLFVIEGLLLAFIGTLVGTAFASIIAKV